MNNLHKVIVCAPINFEAVKQKFKTKKVVTDSRCDNTFCYYFRAPNKGIIIIKVQDWTIIKGIQ